MDRMTMKRALALSSTCLAVASVCPVSAFTSSHRGTAMPQDSRCAFSRGAFRHSRDLALDAPGRRKRSLALASSVFSDDTRFPKSSKNTKDASTTTGQVSKQPKTILSAASIDALDGADGPSSGQERGIAAEYADVASAALLITGNTVGASMMVLPSVASGPGMLPSAGLFLSLYTVNLISGLLLAEVAITQKESTGVDAPSSFKEFASHNLGSESAAKFVSAVSIFVNSCILTFDLTRAGQFVSARLPEAMVGAASPEACTAAAAAGLVGLVATHTDKNLSRFASATVGVLFASFAGFLLPGLANVHDPASSLLAPGTSASGGLAGSLSAAAPVFLTTMVYQNIVPSVTKLLDYDRARTTLAVVIGSFLPLVMYLAFCFAALGGGLDVTTSGGGPLFATFAAASLTGSSVASLMSLAEEYSNNLPLGSKNSNKEELVEQQATNEKTKSANEGEVASAPSVILAGLIPVAAGLAFANGEATAALSTAGSYGSPLLYGALPVAMAWIQRRERGRTAQDGYTSQRNEDDDLVPGGALSLALLGVGALAFVAQNLERDIGGILAAAGFS